MMTHVVKQVDVQGKDKVTIEVHREFSSYWLWVEPGLGLGLGSHRTVDRVDSRVRWGPASLHCDSVLKDQQTAR